MQTILAQVPPEATKGGSNVNYLVKWVGYGTELDTVEPQC